MLKGLETLKHVATLRREALTEASKRTRRNLTRSVRHFLNDGKRDRSGAADVLLDTVLDNDDYGLAVWFFLRDGQEDDPFVLLKRRAPEIWQRVGAALQG